MSKMVESGKAHISLKGHLNWQELEASFVNLANLQKWMRKHKGCYRNLAITSLFK